ETKHRENASESQFLNRVRCGVIDSDWTRQSVSRRTLASEDLSDCLSSQSKNFQVAIDSITASCDDSCSLQRDLLVRLDAKSLSTVWRKTACRCGEIHPFAIALDRERDWFFLVVAHILRDLLCTVNRLTTDLNNTVSCLQSNFSCW